MSKIEWQDPIAGKCTGTDGLGVIVTTMQAKSRDQHLLYMDILVYLDEAIEDPRPAIEAAIATLREELGL